MTRREAEREVVRMVGEAARMREARRELSRGLRRIREEVGRLLPIAEGGGGRKKAAPGFLAETSAEGNAGSVHGGKVAQGARERKGKGVAK